MRDVHNPARKEPQRVDRHGHPAQRPIEVDIDAAGRGARAQVTVLCFCSRNRLHGYCRTRVAVDPGSQLAGFCRPRLVISRQLRQASMISERVYLETSIISYLAARPSRDLVTAARQQLARDSSQYPQKSLMSQF